MGFFQIFLIGVGLSMDAFAISLCQGLIMGKVKIGKTAKIAFTFGIFQAIMPILGYYVGSIFSGKVSQYSNIIAFIILGYLGFNMIREARKENYCCTDEGCSSKALLALGIATSIDALAIGFTFSFLKNFNIFVSSIEIGIITFIISAVGVVLGTKFGTLLESKAQYLGGIILILIGIKSLAGNFA
ncbi:MAG TPA: manganese efflux pump MntP family protein [Fusobacterium ulcerans]|nr:manganese efflux pump MntP family protein [Fusobacterium ulcerans]